MCSVALAEAAAVDEPEDLERWPRCRHPSPTRTGKQLSANTQSFIGTCLTCARMHDPLCGEVHSYGDVIPLKAKAASTLTMAAVAAAAVAAASVPAASVPAASVSAATGIVGVRSAMSPRRLHAAPRAIAVHVRGMPDERLASRGKGAIRPCGTARCDDARPRWN